MSLSVSVFYHVFPHYRIGVLKEIQSRCSAKFYGSSLEANDGIVLVGKDKIINFVDVKNFWFGPFLFQPYVVWRAFFEKADACVFLANPYFLTTWIAAIILRLRKRRIVFWGHGFLSGKVGVKNSIRKIFYSLADSFYSYGHRSRMIAEEFGFNKDSLYVGYNSLDYDRQIAIRESMQNNSVSVSDSVFDSGVQLRILCISRLTKACNYSLLISAAAHLRDYFSINAQIVFVGDGPVRSELEAQCADCAIDSKFLGAIYDDNLLAQYFFQADVTVSPGKVGLTAMHSMMFGTPVVSHSDYESQMPEVEAIIPGCTGFLFKKNDLEDLALVLKSCVTVALNRESHRLACFAVIDELYNPKKQVDILLAAIKGTPSTQANEMHVFEGRVRDEIFKKISS